MDSTKKERIISEALLKKFEINNNVWIEYENIGNIKEFPFYQVVHNFFISHRQS